MFDLIGRGYAMPGERNDAPRGPALAAGREEVSALDRALAIDGMGLPHGHAQSGIRQLRRSNSNQEERSVCPLTMNDCDSN